MYKQIKNSQQDARVLYSWTNLEICVSLSGPSYGISLGSGVFSGEILISPKWSEVRGAALETRLIFPTS